MWIYLLAGIILAVIAWWDGVSHIIPEHMIALLLVCGLARGLWEHRLSEGLVGLVLCGLPILLLSVTLQHGEGIAGGDVKLCAALGSLLGPLDGSLVILIALMGLSLLGLLGRKVSKLIPFAPFVLPAYMAVIFLEKGM